MRVEYVSEYVAFAREDWPTVLIYGEDPSSVTVLTEGIQHLARGLRTHLAVHDCPGFEGVDGCGLIFSVDPVDTGVLRVGSPRTFRWGAPRSRWEDVACLLGPFCRAVTPNSFQYLSDGVVSGIQLIISIKRFGHKVA